MSKTKKAAPKKTAAKIENKNKKSAIKKPETKQPELPKQLPEIEQPEVIAEVQQDSEQPQEEITNDTISVAEVLKRNKNN